jgi:uncharacterized repeat protein (TIGR03803 family)
MNNPRQHRSWISKVCRRVAGAALALAIMLVPAFLATGSAHGQTYKEKVLIQFSGTNGWYPYAGLVQDAQGNLYGTTAGGGYYGTGNVFKLDTSGNETMLYSFNYPGTGDGETPEAGLVLDAQGNLYGTTYQGGANFRGTVFKLDTSGNETLLYSFTGTGGDGAYPYAGLVLDAQGNLYGTTYYGGLGNCNDKVAVGCGVVFKLDTSGNETVLYSFTGTGGDGKYPYAGLVLDAQGNLYGTTYQGGANFGGTVFKLDTTGKETVLYSFGSTRGDGVGPGAGLVLDAQGNLYGTTFQGGGTGCMGSGCGTVFKVDASGKETVLYSFTGTGGDGENPVAVLVRDAQGNLYGTTEYGGASYVGTVFELQRIGTTKTTTTLTSSPNPSTYGQAVVLIAVVAPAPPDGETITFMNGTITLGTGTLSGGSATFTTSALKAGTDKLTAVYDGDSNLAGSTSKTLKQVVHKATTTTTLTSSLNPSQVGQSVTFTASVAPEFSGTVTGKVTFYDGNTKLKAVALSGGQAKYTTSKLTAGTHTITAKYGGSTNFDGSSDSLTQTVN